MNRTAGHDTTSGYENVLPSLPSARYSADEDIAVITRVRNRIKKRSGRPRRVTDGACLTRHLRTEPINDLAAGSAQSTWIRTAQ
jgi:hypothetical protein